MSLINSLKGLCTNQTSAYYSILKKEDDVGIEKAGELIKTYSLNPLIANWKNEEIKKYIVQLVKDTQNIPVTSSNIDIIKEHLRQIAMTCCRCKQYLIEELMKGTKIDKDLRKDIIEGIILTCPKSS